MKAYKNSIKGSKLKI